jgi:hypothetical protein
MAQPLLSEYSADYVDIDYGGILLTGYADTFIEVEFSEADFKKTVGSLGDVTRTRLLDRSGKITVTLMDASPSNDFLSAYAATDRRSGRGYKPFLMRDRSSNTRIKAPQAWIEKLPKVGRGKEPGNTVWVFEAAFLDVEIGGSLLVA